MDLEILKYTSRFIVPFYFDNENNGYKRICAQLDNSITYPQSLGLPKDGEWIRSGFWENFRSDKTKQAEMDIYSYLLSILDDDKAVKSEKNIGASYIYKTDGKIFNLLYKHGDKSITFCCMDAGIVLFRNGIGFLWYETEFNNDKSLSIEEYVDFQHDFKELARTHDDKFVRKYFDKEKNQPAYETFCLGAWLSDFVFSPELEIRFWAERYIEKEGKRIAVPDKALLFQYLFVDEGTVSERNNLAFQTANGYDAKYSSPEDIDEKIYKPFGNASFYLSKSGMSCVVTNDDTNREFFKNQFSQKLIRDYFFVYVLLIFQSYSCANYSRMLTELPADENLFNKKTMYINRLETLNGQINLFLVKSVYESVSNVHHQNGFYRYGKEVLCIEDDIQSLTIGLEALRDIERDKRDRKVDIALVVFGFMVVVSAWIDGLNLVDWFMSNSLGINSWHIGISIIIIVLTIYLIITLLKNRRGGR